MGARNKVKYEGLGKRTGNENDCQASQIQLLPKTIKNLSFCP